MQQLTAAGQSIVSDLAQRYALNEDTVTHMLAAVNAGGGSMAQFNSWELGGSGQWMRGGMTMVGDMFNNNLKNTVDNLCNELSNALASTQMFPVVPAGTANSNQWWPQDLGLGSPFSSGSQNNAKYAIFQNRLAVSNNGEVTVYDTLDHNIGGVGQQQGGNDGLTFTSQYGTVPVASLPVIYGNSAQYAAPAPVPVDNNFNQNTVMQNEPHILQQQDTQGYVAPAPAPQGGQDNMSSLDILAMLEKLGQLHSAGILSDNEFYSKKSELLARL